MSLDNVDSMYYQNNITTYPTVGTVVNISCNHGYGPVHGNNVATCLEGGAWSPAEPACEGEWGQGLPSLHVKVRVC